MIISVLNRVLDTIGIIEDHYSLTWAERYYTCGDFELELPISYDGSPLIEFGNFLYISSSDTLMLIEDMKPSTAEHSTNLVVKGQSAEALLKRRVLEIPRVLRGSAEGTIYSLVSNHVSTPIDPDRKIALFKTTFPSVSLPAVFEDIVGVQTIYDIVVMICKGSEYGFRVVKENDKLAFSVYAGTDRSYSQVAGPTGFENPFVVFSENFDNVIASSFYLSEKGKLNVVRVWTETTYPEPTGYFISEDWVSGPQPSDLDRFEGVLETEVNLAAEEPPIPIRDVYPILETRARTLMVERKTVGVFEGDFDIYGNFKYGVDFFMGDVVQCYIEGRNVKARVIELVRSYSTEGETSYVAMDFISTTTEAG